MPTKLQPSQARILADWRVLCLKIGERLAGTKDERQAAEYVLRRLRAAGCENADIETFPCNSRRRGVSRVEIRERGKWRKVESGVITGSSPTPGGKAVEGDLAWLEMPEQACLLTRDSLKGKVAVIFGPMPEEVDEHKKLVRSNPAAVIQVDHRLPFPWAKNDGTYPLWVKRWGFPVTVTIPYTEAWRWRLKGLKRARVRADIEMVAAESTNVVGDLPGSDPEASMILFGAHHDSQANNVGADDNGSGVVGLLELARLLAPLKRRRTVRFVSFGTEEQLSVGSAAYVRAHRDEMKRIGLMVNFDSYASPLGHTVMLAAGKKRLGEFVVREMGKRGLNVALSTEVVPFADHFCFSVHGVPSLWFYRPNFPGGRWQHHSVHDNLDNVSTEVVAEILSAVGGLVAKCANMRTLPFPRGLDPRTRRRSLELAETLYGFKIGSMQARGGSKRGR